MNGCRKIGSIYSKSQLKPLDIERIDMRKNSLPKAEDIVLPKHGLAFSNTSSPFTDTEKCYVGDILFHSIVSHRKLIEAKYNTVRLHIKAVVEAISRLC
jgi:hypothetical protein